MPKFPFLKKAQKPEAPATGTVKPPEPKPPKNALEALARGFEIPADQARMELDFLAKEIRVLRNAAATATQQERERVMDIYRAAVTTGQTQMLGNLIEGGVSQKEAVERVLEVAAASDPHIQNSHSPEGGHGQTIDYKKIYSKQNRRSGNKKD